MGKALCECPFALHLQQPEKYKQNIDVSPPGQISADANGQGLGAILTKVCRVLLYAMLLNGASAC